MGADSTWLSRASSSLNSLLLLASSIQLGLHFWPSSAYVYGVRVDYLSPTLFLLDIGIILALILQTFIKAHTPLTRSLLAPLILFAFSNLIFASLPLQALLWWARLLCWLCWATNLRAQNIKATLPSLLGWLGLLVALALTQLTLGHSLQGIFYWLGERRFSLGQPGISTQALLGVTHLRAYSIFSHPNIFAGWSILVLALISHYNSSSSRLRFGSYLLGIMVVILTGSRAGAASLLLLMFSYNSSRTTKLATLVLALLIGITLFVSRDDTTLATRIPLIISSLTQFAGLPLFGTGALGSLSTLTTSGALRSFQPDHFTPTLLLSWLGLAGISQLLLLGKKHLTASTSLLFLLPLLVFDHYLLTSLSGLIMLVVVLRSSLKA